MNAPLRYVVLHHTGVADPHFDLMLERESGSLLQTWRSPTWPIKNAGTLAPLPDHRPIYLEYEGKVSGNRGTVRRVSTGTCAVDEAGKLRLTDEAGAVYEVAVPRAAR